MPPDPYHRPQLELTIEMQDQFAAPGPCVRRRSWAPTGSRDNAQVRHALDERGLPRIVQVKAAGV